MDVGVGACKSTVFHFIWVTNTFVWLMEIVDKLKCHLHSWNFFLWPLKKHCNNAFTETPKRKYFYSHERLLSSLNEKGETTHSSATWKMSLLVDLIKCHPLNIFHLLVLQIFWRAMKIQCTWNWEHTLPCHWCYGGTYGVSCSLKSTYQQQLAACQCKPLVQGGYPRLPVSFLLLL